MRPEAARRELPGAGDNPAIDLLLECARREAPLTLIALGPLTNIAAALQRDPTLARRARLVAMTGKLGLPYPDWNLRCDPPAARRVLASGMPTTLVGMHGGFSIALRHRSPNALVCTAVDLERFHALLDTHLFGRPLAVPSARCPLDRLVQRFV